VTEHKTLFGVRLADPRERRQVAGGRGRGGRATSGVSSDTRRFRAVAVGAIAAAVAVPFAWKLVPAPPSPAAGAVALPHVEGSVGCNACHKENDEPAAKACVGCHDAHPSTRAAHRQLAANGDLRCVSCHDIHGADQGVRFRVEDEDHPAEVVRYAVGRWQTIKAPAPGAGREITVPLVPLGRCASCHDPEKLGDPIGRCLVGNQRELGLAAPTVCFDEHQRWSPAPQPRKGGVCSLQHANDRFAAWEAAREVAAGWPVVAAPATGKSPFVWLLTGGGAALVAGLGASGASALARRRKKKAEAPPPMKPVDRVRLPQIDTTTCLGCYACVDACPYDVLAVERYVAVVARPEACCGLTLCQQVCPNGSLVVTDGEPIGDRPHLGDDLQAIDAPGVYLAGDITGLPLIKNAILQGARVVEGIHAAMPRHAAELDLVVVGAGPAGISAALKAKELGLRCEVIEQGGVAQSIKSFPRGKLVFDQPLELPVAGKLWLEEATKEELLVKWLRIVREEKLVIHEGHRFASLARRDGILAIVAENAAGERIEWRAARLLLAIGLRGSPRKLDVDLAPDVEAKVFYHLADAKSFAGQRVLVVGLGDVAMETAIAISRQPDTEVTVAYRGDGFSRGKSRNITELKRLVEAGRVRLVTHATVRSVAATAVKLDTPNGVVTVQNDAVFVMIGSKPPRELLERAGVKLGAPTSEG
jgi:thioredoxin reductase/NAD-dependent dihydropyrimidine dehydrogenase PreA subunit